MARFHLSLLLAAGSLAVFAGTASAQPIPPSMPQTPTFSPYLNMLRGGNAGLNYFGLVQPQLQLNDQFGQLQSRMGMMQRDIGQNEVNTINNLNMINPYLRTTGGFVPRFDDLSGYFNRISGIGGTMGSGSMGGQGLRPMSSGAGTPRQAGFNPMGGIGSGFGGGYGGSFGGGSYGGFNSGGMGSYGTPSFR